MARFWIFLIMVILVIMAGGATYLMTADIKAPTGHVEKTLPNDMFPK